MLQRPYLRLIGGLAFGLLAGTSNAQQNAALVIKTASGINFASTGSLLRQGTDVSAIRPAFAGPVCAKGRVTPEFEDFCDGSAIVFEPTWYSHGIVEYDGQNVIEGSQSTKIIPLRPGGQGSSYFHYDFPNGTTYDWQHKSIKIRFFIPPEDHNIAQVSVGLRSQNLNATYPVWWVGNRRPRTGWIEYAFTPTQNYQTTNVSVVDRIQLLVQRGGDDNTETYILVNGLTVWDGRLKVPLYCCTFDDNYIRQFEAAKYAVGKGVPVSLFINKNWSDGLGVHSIHGMTLSQNQELESLGCVHINHGVSHSPPAPVTEGHKEIMGFTSASGGSKTQLAVPDHGCVGGDQVLIMGTKNYNSVAIAIESVTPDSFIIPLRYIAEDPCGIIARRTQSNDLWSNPETPIEELIADIEENRQWMKDNGLGFGSHIFGSPQEWWFDHHEQHLRPYMFGRPRQGRGLAAYGLLTMWDQNTEVRSACDTHLANAYKMLRANVGTLLWTPGTYPQGTLREWTDGGIYTVTIPAGTAEIPSHADWSYLRQRGDQDRGDCAVQVDVWHQGPDGWYLNEGSLQDFKDYIDVVAAHIAAGRLRAVDLRDLYENYLYTTTPSDVLTGDIDGDGKVDLNDFAIMAENWLKQVDSK